MTTGTVDQKDLLFDSTRLGIPIYRRFRKEWSGSDDPSLTPKANREVRLVEVPDKLNKVGEVIFPRHYRFIRAAYARPVKRDGAREDHPYDVVIVKVREDEYTFNGVNGTASSHLRETTWPHGHDYTVNDDLILLDKLRERIAGSSFNAAVSVAELPEALLMIKNSAQAIAKSITAVRRGNIQRAKSLLLRQNAMQGRDRKVLKQLDAERLKKQLELLRGEKHPAELAKLYANNANARGQTRKVQHASTWLQLQYGWIPVLSDIHNAAVFIDHQLRFPLERRFTAKQHQHTSKRSKADGAFMMVDRPPFEIARNHSHGISYQVKAKSMASKKVIARVREKDIPRLTGLYDPLSVIWEKLPFSFAVDWFIPIQSYLSARALNSAVSARYVVTTRYKLQLSGPVVCVPTNATWNIDPVTNGKDFLASYELFKREILTDLVPLIRAPVINPLVKIATWKHAANAVALVTSIFGKK